MNIPDEFNQQKEFEKNGFNFKRRNPFFTSLFAGIGLCLGLALGYAYGHLGLFMLLGLALGYALGTGVDYRQALKASQKEQFLQQEKNNQEMLKGQKNEEK